MYQLFQWMNRDENIRNAIKLFEQPGCHSIYGLGGSVKSAFAAKALTETGKQAVIIVQSKEQLTAWQSDLQFIVPDLHILNFPGKQECE